METRELKDFITLVQGINPTRAEKQFENQTITYYDQASFDDAFNHRDSVDTESIKYEFDNKATLNLGDLVISSSLQRAAVVRQGDVGKVLSLNFVKVILDDERLDKNYLLFLFNEFKDVKIQKEKELQGAGLIRRIPISSLEKIKIPVIPIEEQRKIGTAYIEMLKLQTSLRMYTSLIKDFTISIIEDNLRGGE